MDIDRRRLIATAGAALIAAPAAAAPLSTLGLDATQFGLRAGASDDQSLALQKAINQTAAARVPLVLGPGVYRAGDLKLPTGAQLVGVRGATRLLLSRGPSLLSASRADHLSLSGLIFDGGASPLPDGRGLVHLAIGRGLRISDCEIVRAGGTALSLAQIEGAIRDNTITDAGDIGLHSLDAQGLVIAGNSIRGSGNGGIRVWQSEKRDDGTLIVDNRIEDTAARAGGSGQNGNAINIFRASNVVVRGNRIRNAAFTAVRGNAASNVQIVGNSCTGLGEVAIYSEFDFEGAVIASNTIDDAAIGVSISNFKQGGRLAVVHGNLIRNVTRKRPEGTDPDDGFAIGISVEADTAVTGNVIENAPNKGIVLGWGEYLRDVTVTGNIVRQAGYGITVSVAPGAGAAVIADNLIADVRRGAIVGTEWGKPVTGDLARDGAGRYAQLAINGNRVR
jgi:uncharacterized secreted repeat protein (TIGR03808 family)